jgi:hypothetical protein
LHFPSAYGFDRRPKRSALAECHHQRLPRAIAIVLVVLITAIYTARRHSRDWQAAALAPFKSWQRLSSNLRIKM